MLKKVGSLLAFLLLIIPFANASQTLYFDPTYKIEDGQAIKQILLPQGIAIQKNYQVLYIYQNPLGSTALLTDENGIVVGDYKYYPYGDELSFTAEHLTEHKYTGQILDNSTGLY